MDISSMISHVRDMSTSTELEIRRGTILSPVTKHGKSLSRGAIQTLLGCFGGRSSRRRRHRPALLPEQEAAVSGRICAVIDLDETLIYSTFTKPKHVDFTISVEIDGKYRPIYVQKRPHLDEFLQRMGELFECVLFTASVAKYASPVCDKIDQSHAISHMLYREACVLQSQYFVKDLSRLGRQMERCFIIDNSPISYLLHRDNAVPITSWMGNPSDTELLKLLPYMQQLAEADSVIDHLQLNPPPTDADGSISDASSWSSLADSESCFSWF